MTLGKYLETLERPLDMTDDGYRKLRNKSRNFLVHDGLLFKRGRRRGQPPRRVLGLPTQRREAIRQLHDECGHCGIRPTFEQLARRYQWQGMWEDVKEFCQTCEECQRRSRIRYEEPLHPTFTTIVWEKIGVDVVYMPISTEGYGFIVFARDDLSGWVEARPLLRNNARSVANFIYQDVICRHGCPLKIVMNHRSENMDITSILLETYNIHQIHASAYHPQTNELVERGHDLVINALSKYCAHSKGDWPKYLSLALWADRVSVRESTGYSAFELLYGRDCLLPVKFTLESWNIVDWEEEVRMGFREDLILARMRQLDQRNIAQARAAEKLKKSRLGNKAYFDQCKRLRPDSQQLHVGDLILLHDTRHFNDRGRERKLDYKWNGPYRIRSIGDDSTYYMLEELDGTQLRRFFAGNRLKRFFSRPALNEIRQEIQNTIRVRHDFEDDVVEGDSNDGEQVVEL